MINNITIDLTRAIIEVLSQLNKPMSLDEISFRTRSPQTIVNNTLSRLAHANIVFKEGNNFRLNKEERQYKLKSLID